jgi:hypothetical protein
MHAHVRVLGVLYLAISVLSLLAALFLLVVIGGIATVVGLAADPGDAVVAVPILGVVGTVVATVLIALAVPGLVAGWGLLTFRPWARVLALVLSALNILNIPIGTALGIYGLWVLLHRETEPLFSAPMVPHHPA